MPDDRIDDLSGAHVVVAGSRQHRPNRPGVAACPFCVGGLEAPAVSLRERIRTVEFTSHPTDVPAQAGIARHIRCEPVSSRPTIRCRSSAVASQLPAHPGVLCASCNARKGLSQRRR